MTSDAQQQTVDDVERVFREEVSLKGDGLDRCFRLWHDFTDQVDVSRTRKPETWAAALAYTYDCLHFGGVTQEDAAEWFGVSAITVSQKYRQIAETLNLKLFDPRYLAEARRAALRREFGSLPEDLPLLDAPSHYWHVSPDAIGNGSGPDAQELVYDGWDALGAGNLRAAEQRFRDALDHDKCLADAYNGLGDVAEARGDLDAAADHYRTAYERARETLGTESPDAFYWWGELDTRPYMRALQGLGWVHWQAGRYERALDEYEALLRLNPDDNQGARYVVGPLYQLAGNREGALEAYRDYAEQYPDDRGDPHHTFCWGLALYRGDEPAAALDRWREGFFQNLYVAPLLLDEPAPETDIWHSTNLEYPSYAEQYVDLYGTLWDRDPDARPVLHRLWHDPDTRTHVDRWLEMGQTLDALAETARSGNETAREQWRDLMDEQQAIERSPVSPATKERVLE